MMVIFATSRQSRRLEKGFEGEEELGAGRGRAKRGEELQSLEDCSTC